MPRPKKDDRSHLTARVHEDTQDKLKAFAQKIGYTHGGEGSIGQLLDAIAKGEVALLYPVKETINVLQGNEFS